MMNKVINLNCMPIELLSLISNTNPLSFVFVEIRSNSRIPTMPSMVQLVTKLVSPLRGGIGLEIIPLLV